MCTQQQSGGGIRANTSTFNQPAYNSRGTYTAVIMAFAFLIGLQIANVFLNPLKSGASTIFVAMVRSLGGIIDCMAYTTNNKNYRLWIPRYS